MSALYHTEFDCPYCGAIKSGKFHFDKSREKRVSVLCSNCDAQTPATDNIVLTAVEYGKVMAMRSGQRFLSITWDEETSGHGGTVIVGRYSGITLFNLLPGEDCYELRAVGQLGKKPMRRTRFPSVDIAKRVATGMFLAAFS